jgi:hypothetical protein
MQPNPNLFPVSPTNGIAPLSPGSFGWPLQPKPRFLGLAPETEMFMFDVVGDASSGSFDSIITSTGFWVIKNDSSYFEVVPVGGNPSDLSALSGIYRIYSSDAQGSPAGVITSIVVFDVPMDPIDFSGLPSLLDVTWNGAIAAPLLSGSPLVFNVDYSNGAIPAPPDFSPNPLLEIINLVNCGLTTRPDFTVTPLVQGVNLQFNALPASEINLLLHEINLHNTNNVTVNLDFGTNAAPDTTSGGVNGVAAAAAIVSRGGSVTTNSPMLTSPSDTIVAPCKGCITLSGDHSTKPVQWCGTCSGYKCEKCRGTARSVAAAAIHHGKKLFNRNK